jgi:hypothetical protein
MAHEINIPVTFEFRTCSIQWQEVPAHVTGWRRDQAGLKKPTHLIAQISRGGTNSTISVSVGRLPETERKLCLATLGKSHSDEAVTEICSELGLRYYVHNTKTFIEDSELRKHSHAADAWILRDELLKLEPEPEAVLAFLTKWGRWTEFRNYVDAPEIVALQQAVRQGLTAKPANWFQSSYAAPLTVNSRTSGFPYFVMLTDSSEKAIRMATTIDLLRELKFKTCARSDCGMPFQVTSKHEKSYCRQYCAHLESVRRARKSAAERSK